MRRITDCLVDSDLLNSIPRFTFLHLKGDLKFYEKKFQNRVAPVFS